MEAELNSSQEDPLARISQDSIAQESWTSQAQDSPTSVLQPLRGSETVRGSLLDLYSQASDARTLKSPEVQPRSFELHTPRATSSHKLSIDRHHPRSSARNVLRSSEARESHTSISQTSLSLGERPSQSSSGQGSRTSIPRASQNSISQDAQTAGPQTSGADNIAQNGEAQDSHGSEGLGPVHYRNSGSHRHHSGYLADDEGTLGLPQFQVHKRPVCPEMGPLHRVRGPLRPPCPFHIPMPPRPRGHKKPLKAEPFSEFLDFLAMGPVLDSLQVVVDEASRKVTQLRTEADLPLVDVEKGPSRKAKERRDAVEAARTRLYPGFPNNYPSSSSSDSTFYYSPDDCRVPADPRGRGIFLNPQWLHPKVSRFERWSPVSRLPPIGEKFQLERDSRHILRKKSKDPTCSPKEDFFLWKKSVDPLKMVLSKEQRLAWLSKLLDPVQKESSKMPSLLEIFSALEKASKTKASSPQGTCSPAWKPSPTEVPSPVQMPSTTCPAQMPSPVRLPSPSSIPSPPSLPCMADKASQTEEAILKRPSSLKHIPTYRSSAAGERSTQTEVSCSTEMPSHMEQELPFIKQEFEKELVDLLLGSLSSTSSSSAELPSYCPTREPFHTLDFLAEHQLFPALQDVVTQTVLKLSLARRQNGFPLFPMMPETETREEEFEENEEEEGEEKEEEEEEEEKEEDPNAGLWEHITHKAVWYLPDTSSKDDSKIAKSHQGKNREQRPVLSLPPTSATVRRRREKAMAEARALAEAKAQAQEARVLAHVRARVRKDSESMRQVSPPGGA